MTHQMGKGRRVSMVVWNEFTNDARVLKEAQTLQQASYFVTVHALHTPGKTKEREILEEGIVVRRVLRSPFWSLRRRKKPSRSSSTGADSGVHFAERSRFYVRKNSVGEALRLFTRVWTHARLLVQIIQSKPDIVEAHDVNTLPTAWLASRIRRVPLIYDAHEISTSREGYASFRGVVAAVEKRLARQASGTITTTTIRAKFLARAYGIATPLVLQNRPRYKECHKNDRIKRELGLKQSWPVIVYQGGLQEGRGLQRLVLAAKEIAEAYFVFIGGGQLESQLRALVESEGLQGKVFFIPTVPLGDLLEYTSSADIGVQPIDNTCFNHFSTDSNKIFEYIIAGLPVVASGLPEIRRIVDGHEVGLVFTPGDTKDLTRKIQVLVEDPDLRSSYGEKAKVAAKQLNWENQESLLIDLFDSVCRSPEKPVLAEH
jgi:glycosyltransferase involved in cell wall biosynthesis